MTVTTPNPLSRDYSNGVSLNGTDSSQRAAHSSPWGNSIWNTPLGAFARPRDTSALAGASDLTEGKTGSSSLVADSETEWRPTARVWGEKPSANTTPARSSAVSPVRKRSITRTQQPQQYGDSTPSSYLQSSRGTLSKPVKPFADAGASNLTSRQVDELNTGFTKFGFSQADVNPVRPDTGVTSWPDTGSVHSPNEDRRSVANSEYFASSSGAPSRSGSLPPSRHGAEPAQYNQTLEAFSRLSQQPRQASSFSMATGRGFPERNGSIQSDSFSPIGKPTHDQEHRLSISHNFATSYTPGQDMNDLLCNTSYLQASARAEDSTYRSPGTYTPEGYANAQSSQYAQLRSYQIDNSRNTPNGTGVRQSPYYSHINTPPVYDRLNPYSSEQTLAHPNSVAQLQSKLVGFQMAQQERRIIPPSQLHQQQFQQLYAAAQLQNSYPYHLAMSNGLNGMHLSAIPQHMNMAPMAPMMPVQQQPPRGPREHQMSDGLGAMSIELSNFKREQKQSKRWELTDIKDHVVEFAGDQHGSRFIQQKLETANSEVKESVFRELEENALQLMQDVFGNYVIQKFFEHGDQVQKKILVGKMKGHVLELANQMYACRVVQKALEHALTEQQAAMVKELEKDVLKTVKDQNGNHVIQKVIDRVPMQHIQKIVEAFRGNVGVLSVNSYGCRVIQRLLEKVQEPQRRFILTELHAEGPKLITDQYGNYVTQHVIEHGLPEDRAKIVSLIKAQFLMFSKHKFASNVVERCLICGDDAQRRQLVAVVLSKNERGETNVMNLLRDGYGNYVIQKLLDTLGRNDYEMFVQALKPELEKAKKVIPGKQCVSVEKKMYRYDRIDSPTMPTPALSSSAQSPQSSSHPSTNVSTIDEPVDTTSLDGKHNTGGVSIKEAAY
ncbi:mRNA binding protein Pumilio 2 [Pyrenophora tritici-repentis]|nr:mRNA binding protein Pumilio 2 [Pyrenophora tritici-repentis]PZC95669.1 RNA-binding proteinPuf family, translational repressor [Pyrenophora tritici-repentis]PZD40289.1 RNA-binding proteinPuf family, translational repressor [Pyrenophora tritici-repentis]